MTGTALSGRKYKAYPEYKESTIDWLDKIPVNWETKRLKHLGQAIIGLTYSPDEIVEEKEESSALVLRSSNVQSQKIAFDDNVFVNKEIPERLRTQINDILICSRNGSRALIGKNALIDAQSVDMSFGAFMTIFRSEYNKYLSHVMNSKLFEYQSGSFLTSTINQLTTGNLNSFEIPFPTRSERDSIAKFLDHETAKIDTLIAKQKKLIELLKEKRQAVISHAVTKGLNPNAPMRDSGVEWLGEVPEHWIISPSKRLFPESKNRAPTSDMQLSATQDYGVISQKKFMQLAGRKVVQLNSNQELRKKVHVGDFVISMRSFQGGLERAWEEGGIRSSYVVLKPSKTVNKDYFQYLFKSVRYIQAIQSTANFIRDGQDMNYQNFILIDLPIPSLEEQENIASFLCEHINKIDSLVGKAQKAISLMQERKTALISAAVTGKIDVRDWEDDDKWNG